MTGNEVTDRVHAPFVIEGHGEGAPEIYFESEQSKQDYLAIPSRTPELCSIRLYRLIEDNELWD